MFNEGQETESEQMLRERKDALSHLFKILDLRPRTTGLTSDRDRKLGKDDLRRLTQRSKQSQARKSPKTEIVGDGEEVEIEADGEDLSENELDLIYKKYVCFAMLFVYISNTFNLLERKEMTALCQRWSRRRPSL